MKLKTLVAIAALVPLSTTVLGSPLTLSAADEAAAAELLQVGESLCDTSLNASQLAAWTMVANMLLNLDETITKA